MRIILSYRASGVPICLAEFSAGQIGTRRMQEGSDSHAKTLLLPQTQPHCPLASHQPLTALAGTNAMTSFGTKRGCRHTQPKLDGSLTFIAHPLAIVNDHPLNSSLSHIHLKGVLQVSFGMKSNVSSYLR